MTLMKRPIGLALTPPLLAGCHGRGAPLPAREALGEILLLSIIEHLGAKA
jgi:hypothetical protein